MNKNLLFSMLALTACAFADGDTNSSTLLADDNLVAGRMDSDCKPKPVECKPKPVECKPKPKPCVPCVRKGIAPIVLTSSRPCDDIGLYLFADALYWHADVTNAEWAFVNSTGTTAPVSGKNEELAFKWNWGFRVGLGYEFDHDQWDTDIYYTWFVNNTASNGSTSSTSFSVPTGGAASSLNTDSSMTTGTVTSGSASAKLKFNVLDWELGRSFYISNSISLRPHVGVKGAWHRLNETESFSGTGLRTASTYTSSDATKSWAVGPSAGINSNWYFGCANTMPANGRGDARDRPGFSIFGDVSGALMYGHFSNKHTETGATATGAVSGGLTMSGLNRNLMVPVLTGIMGLAWDMCFDCDKMHLGIRAGYELQYWFRQNQRFSNFTVPGTAAPRYTRTTGDLALQGLTIDVRFDF